MKCSLSKITTRVIAIGLAFTGALKAYAAVPAPVLPDQMTLFLHQTSVTTIHPGGASDDGPAELGDVTLTKGYLTRTETGAQIGTYNVQKLLVSLEASGEGVRSNLVYYKLPHGTLYVQGFNTTAAGSTHPTSSTRPIVGGTGRYAAARGVAKTEGVGTDLLKTTFTFYR